MLPPLFYCVQDIHPHFQSSHFLLLIDACTFLGTAMYLSFTWSECKLELSQTILWSRDHCGLPLDQFLTTLASQVGFSFLANHCANHQH